MTRPMFLIAARSRRLAVAALSLSQAIAACPVRSGSDPG
jgi:hypothetical protein